MMVRNGANNTLSAEKDVEVHLHHYPALQPGQLWDVRKTSSYALPMVCPVPVIFSPAPLASILIVRPLVLVSRIVIFICSLNFKSLSKIQISLGYSLASKI